MAFVPSGAHPDPGYRARSYQLEMFEASLKDNIVVAMGTGSGKTHIALLRIMHELENGDGNKLIWFLAPTVALCLQQHRAISQHIPAAKSRTLTGLDKVELWTEQVIWDSVLSDIQVVVSTPAVLLDAMTHGFVRVSRLGLIIFDEAHHCTRNHPANSVMRYFYHPTRAKSGPNAVPRILGLTASAGSDRDELRTLEDNLNSVCTTPQVHRHELLEHTHRPRLQRVLYAPQAVQGASLCGGTEKALVEAYQMLDIENDSYVKRLKASEPHGVALQRVLMTGNTYCSEQLKKFYRRVAHISTELGPWAADYFIWESTQQLRGGALYTSLTVDMDDEERKYLIDILSKLPAPEFNIQSTNLADFPVSPKFEALISFLLSTDESEFSGLIFVQQRATVAVMARLLSVHPSTRDRFRTDGFIGMSNFTKKKEILGDLLTVKMQRDTLDDFRDGRKNLIVATNVLEEGIDVSACSVVVCYDKPQNLKSLVQRRGRARRQHSTYAIVLSTEEDVSSLDKWHNVEKAMEEAYQEDRSRLEELRALETINEDVHAQFVVESTGAILTADNAMQHLYHFCSTLPSQRRVRMKPEFTFERHEGGALKGKVTLPSCVVPSARCAEGILWLKTERAARKEAAFQAYKGLYEHGLVNNNLLPLTKSQDFTKRDRRLLGPMTEVLDQYDPWVDWAYAWMLPNVHKTRVTVRVNEDELYMNLFTPVAIPLLEPLTLFWDSESTYTLEFGMAEPISTTDESVESLRAITALYLQTTSTRWLGGKCDYTTLFSPHLHPEEWMAWLSENEGYEPASEVFCSQRSADRMGIIRDRSRYDSLLLLNRWVNGSDGLELECEPFPKRRDLLRRQTISTKGYDSDERLETPTKRHNIPADQCRISRLPAKEAVFGRFIAVIIDRLEAALVATKLCETILGDIHFNELRHVITAITTPAAEGPTHYQRYEFFGDTVLKFTVASSLYHQHPNWHEGYLAKGLQAIVENHRLAREAVDRGLGSFIISKKFSVRKWSAPLISEKLDTNRDRREMSTKVLADVVEALIGAAYIDGGLAKAQACITHFLPEVQLQIPRPDCSAMSQDQDHKPHLIQQQSLEEKIGYAFNDKSLLMEALTHGSCQHDASTQSYQRLEFLGDAVLDMLIVDTIIVHPTQLPQGKMTKIKAAVANASLLAFLCMEFSWPMPSRCPTTVPEAEVGMESTEHASKTLHLYTYLRHSPGTLLITNNANLDSPSNTALNRYTTLRPAILHSLCTSRTYPRELLSALNPDKFFSDIIESIIGAIFVDSGGDLTPCREFIHRLGLLQYLERILDKNIDVEHPMQKAQMGLQKLASKAGSQWKFKFYTVRVLGSTREHKRVYKVVDGDVVADVDADAVEGRNGDLDPSNPGPSPSSDSDSDSDPDVDYSAGPTYTCTIPVNGLGFDVEEVVVTGRLSREDAEVRAACVVIELLTQKGVIIEADDGAGDREEELEQAEVA